MKCFLWWGHDWKICKIEEGYLDEKNDINEYSKLYLSSKVMKVHYYCPKCKKFKEKIVTSYEKKHELRKIKLWRENQDVK
jgi:hypothetical protein